MWEIVVIIHQPQLKAETDVTYVTDVDYLSLLLSVIITSDAFNNYEKIQQQKVLLKVSLQWKASMGFLPVSNKKS
jgi:hypothetical protein